MMIKFYRIGYLALLANAFLFSAESLWNASGDGNWGDNFNWFPTTVPDDATTFVTFGSSITSPTTVTVDGTFSLADLNFNSTNAYTLSTGTLNLNGDVQVASGNGAHVIGSNLVLTGATGHDFSNLSSNILTVSGVISGAIAADVIIPNGVTVFSGANTFQGTIAISEGTLRVSEAQNLGNAGSPIDFLGGILQTTATFTLSKAINLIPGGGSLLGIGNINTNSGTVFDSIGVSG